MFKRIPEAEVKTVAARAMVSGDLHEAGGDLVGLYCDTLDVAIGDPILLHTEEWGTVVAPSALTLAAGADVLFDLATQEAVATGGTLIGKAIYAKTSGQTVVAVALNNSGMPAA